MPDTVDLAIDALAVARLARLITTDTFPPVRKVREAIQVRYPDQGQIIAIEDGWLIDERFARRGTTNVKVQATQDLGTALVLEGHPIGELLSCSWCTSVWCAFVALGARAAFPRGWAVLARALAFSEVAGVLANWT